MGLAPYGKPKYADLIRDHGLNHACWALLNSSEFLYSP